MDEKKIEDARMDSAPSSETAEDRLRIPVTILFSDIKGSTPYFERKGDVEGLAMVERHHRLLLPCVERHHGRLVKTIGDAIMARFADPADAIRAAVAMQNALAEDGRGRPESERIHVRIGIHSGLGLVRDDDVFGDVVNAAARVQSQSEGDQILVTDSLISAVHSAGYQVGKLGRTKLKGKDEPIDIYAVAWSGESIQRLLDTLQERFGHQLQEMKDSRLTAEEALDGAQDEWRSERRRLHREIERLEQAAAEMQENARAQVTEELHKQMQLKVEAAERTRHQAEEDLRSVRERFETERVGYKAQIESLEHRLVGAIEQVNNPARIAAEIREEVQQRLKDARQEWESNWEAERRRFVREIERLKSAGSKSAMAEARRMMMARLQARQEGRPIGSEPVVQELERERDELKVRVQSLENELKRNEEATRRDVYRQLRHRYDQQLEQSEHLRQRLEQEVAALRNELEGERRSLHARIREIQASIPDVEEAARAQAGAEIRSEYETKLDESERSRQRLERRYREAVEEWAAERRRLEKQLEISESNLQEARDMAFKKSSDPTIEELSRLRWQLEEEFQAKMTAWDEEKRRLMDRIGILEHPSSDHDARW